MNPFWIVWDVDSSEPIKGNDGIAKHPTEEHAVSAAECCAELLPGSAFRVMRVDIAIARVSTSRVPAVRAETVRA